MKNWIKVAGILVLTLPVMAQAEDYPYTTNITITLPLNQIIFASYAYESTNNTVEGLFKGLPMGSHIYKWDTYTQSWRDFIKVVYVAPNVATNRLPRGAGFAIKTSAASIDFSGAIPAATTTAVYKVKGYNLLAFPYPADVAFTNTQIAKMAVNGEKIMVWDVTSQTYKGYNRGLIGWSSANGLVLKNCSAFFYYALRDAVVYEKRP